MRIDDMRKIFNAFWQKYESEIIGVADNIFHKKISVTSNIIQEISIQNHWMNEAFPRIVIRFALDNAAQYHHFLFFEPEVGLKLFAWMIDAEPDTELSEEHLEGIKEAAQQIWGQIQSSLSSEENVQIKDLEVFHVQSAKDAKIDPQQEGIIAQYQIVADSDKFNFTHYMWSPETLVGETPNDQTDEAAGDDPMHVHPVDFQNLNGGPVSHREPRNIDMLLDVELDVYVELGRKSMVIRDVLKLGKGAIVELDKAAGEPLGIYVNGRKFAEGEVVVVDDQFGIRITQLVNPKERIRSLA